MTSLIHNNTVGGLSLSNISHSPSNQNQEKEKELGCCIDNCTRLSDKIMNFLNEKGVITEEDLHHELKNLIRIEILKIPIKPKNKNNSNLSNIDEVLTENLVSCNKNSPKGGDKKTPNLHLIQNEANLNTTITEEASRNNLNSQQQPQKIIMNNIKHVIQNNKNSRNHKDIIHEDYITNSDKYNLNNLGKSNTNSTNTQNMISETYFKNSGVSRMTEAERHSLKNLLQQNKQEKRTKMTPHENIVKAFNRNTRNNHIQNGMKLTNLLSLHNSSIKKKVKSFSPSYKSILNTSPMGNRVPALNKDKYLKNCKFSYDYPKKNATRNNINRMQTENSNSASKQFKNFNSTVNQINTSDLKSIKKSLNLSEIYSKILSMNNKGPLLKNFYPNERKVTEGSSIEKNLRYVQHVATEGNVNNVNRSSVSPQNSKNSKNKSNLNNLHHVNLNPKSIHTTNYEKFKYSKLYKFNSLQSNKPKTLGNINSSFTANKATSKSKFIKTAKNEQNEKSEKNEANKEKSKNSLINKSGMMNLNATYQFPQGNTMIFNNNFFNNVNNYTSNISILKDQFKTTSTNNENPSINQEKELLNKRSSKDLMKEIKKNLDENYKNFFNFSYDNYLNKEFSESINTNSDEILNTHDNLDSAHNNEEILDKGKLNYTNEISFEDQDNKIKNMIFRK
jgi:hypothetical protein